MSREGVLGSGEVGVDGDEGGSHGDWGREQGGRGNIRGKSTLENKKESLRGESMNRLCLSVGWGGGRPVGKYRPECEDQQDKHRPQIKAVGALAESSVIAVCLAFCCCCCCCCCSAPAPPPTAVAPGTGTGKSREMEGSSDSVTDAIQNKGNDVTMRQRRSTS
ncbi:uncharacterized protein LOC135200679 [Macrobrachium nipponense]|uniref:uncharacterized protein LOC135200679 n=1 Tax=Macrobrachium nipponense TaxID=159736 RepID=UPI0030C820C5